MITAREGKVYRGLIDLLSYALYPENSHSCQWISPLLTHLFTRQIVPIHRCPVCGGLAPRCRCWERDVSHA
jgi:hypothetical protein